MPTTNFGKPWKNLTTCLTFDDADNRRKQVLAEGNFECKVHRQFSGFVVKVRELAVQTLPEQAVEVLVEDAPKVRVAKPKQAARRAAKNYN